MLELHRLLARAAAVRPPPLPVAALLIILAHAGFVLSQGVLMAPDSAGYAFWSQRLVDTRFDYPALVPQVGTAVPAYLYALFVTLIALLRMLLGNDWAAGLVALNFAAHVALGLMIVRLAMRIGGSGAAGWTALALFLACYDLLNWVPFVLSDATFAALAFFIFTLAAARILGERKSWLPVALPAAAGIFFRPTGIVLVPDLLGAAYLSRRTASGLPRGPLILFLAAFAAGGAALFAWIVQDPSRWPFDTLAQAFGDAAREYALGEVVSARPETFHGAPGSLLDYLLITGDRFLHFFAVGAAGFGTAHWVANAAFFLPCYGLAAFMLASLWQRADLGEREEKVLIAAAGAILSYALFHALVQVDFDWRYRVPVLPHLILLASAGAARLLRPPGGAA